MLGGRHFGQLEQTFPELASVRWQEGKKVGAKRIASSLDITREGDYSQFLRRLNNFTETEVHRKQCASAPS